MNYGQVLRRAWEITWRWKILWILGFLAGLSRISSVANNGFQYRKDVTDWNWQYQLQVAPRVWGLIAALSCLALFIGIAIWVITIIARGGLIAGVQQVEDEGTTRFGQAWRVGVKRFWTLFGISVLVALPLLILFLVGAGLLVLFVLGVVGASGNSANAGNVLAIVLSVLCGGTLFCGTILVAIVLSQIQIYADRAAVLENMGWIDAFKRGWQVLKENLGHTIVLWLIFVVIGFLFAAVILAGIAALVAPFAAVLSSVRPGMWLAVPLVIGVLLAIVVGGIVGAIVETFTSATWTLAYRELTGLVAVPETEPVDVE